MKHTYVFLLVALAWNTASAQSSAINNAILDQRMGSLDKARTYIDQATADPKTSENPKTWYTRGEIYEAMATNPKYSKLLTEEQRATEAYKSYQKALALAGPGTQYGKLASDKLAKFPSIEPAIGALAISLVSYSPSTSAVPATNIIWQARGNTIDITYTLPNVVGEEIVVQPVLHSKTRPDFTQRPKALSGAAGRGRFAGPDKHIFWAYTQDSPKGLAKDEYYFTIEVNPADLPTAAPGTELFSVTTPAQTFVVQCAQGSDNSSGILIIKGVQTVTNTSQLKSGDFITGIKNEGKPTAQVSNCMQLNAGLLEQSKLMQRNRTLVINRGGQIMEVSGY